MPRGDRTGPTGQGPKTGRGQGNCTVNIRKPSIIKPGIGNQAGLGRGIGRGIGRGNGTGFVK